MECRRDASGKVARNVTVKACRRMDVAAAAAASTVAHRTGAVGAAVATASIAARRRTHPARQALDLPAPTQRTPAIDRLGDVLDNPAFLPFQLDLEAGRVLLVRLDAETRANAPFLDQRALPPKPEGYWLPLDALLARSAAPDAARLDWIFHIGHCGSTLLSRLLQAWPALQVLREPQPLRTLAAADMDAMHPAAEVMQRLVELWSRPLPSHSRSLIKASSSCNALAGALLVQRPQARAVLLDMPLEPYLATMLKSGAAFADVAAAAPGRRRVLAGGDDAIDAELATLAQPEQCAMGWLAEQLRFRDLAAGRHGGRVLRVDFEALLAHPHDTLAAIAGHLDLPAAQLDAVLASPWWGRYSKAGAHAYAPRDRQHDLELSRQRHGEAIAAAQSWLQGFLRRHPRLADRARL